MIGELVGIQYLRGIAAVMVLLFHLPVQLGHMGYDGPWLRGLAGGVDIFFVISGFIMWVTTARAPAMRPIDFWRRRLTRVAPLYWIMTGFVTLVMLLAPAALQSSRFHPGHVLASFLFVAARHPVAGTIEPVIIPGWTLNYEMFFYLIFGLFLLARPPWRFAGTVSCLLLLVVLGMMTGVPRSSIAGFYTSPVMLEFALGMAIGVLASRDRGLATIAPPMGWLLAIVGLICVIVPPDLPDVSRLLTRGIFSAMVVLGAVVIEAHHRVPRIAPLHALGDASYSIYLSHVITLSATSQLWRKLHLDGLPYALWIYAIVAVAVGLVAGLVLYAVVERPLIALFRARSRVCRET
ncbi:MAG: oatA [Rhizorhabdus sp.]|nr:oatA [Rhizorhabdus sp.]